MSDVLTSTYTNTSTGVREMQDTVWEDIWDTITNITPADTPFLSAIGKRKVANVLFEWLEDELKSPTGTNKAVEGADAVATTRSQPVRLNNYVQIFSDSFKVSGTVDAEKTIGRDKVSSYEASKSIKYLLTEMEYALINNATNAAGDASTARQTKGMAGFLTTNDKSFASYAATNDFEEDKFVAMAEACYSTGGKPTTLLVPPSQARKIAWWNGAGKITTMSNATDKEMILSVLVLETPFGRVKVVIDRFIANDNQSGTLYNQVYLIEPEKFRLATLRPMKTTQLAKTGDADKWQTLCEVGLECRAEKAMAVCGKCATDYTSTAPSRG